MPASHAMRSSPPSLVERRAAAAPSYVSSSLHIAHSLSFPLHTCSISFLQNIVRRFATILLISLIISFMFFIRSTTF